MPSINIDEKVKQASQEIYEAFVNRLGSLKLAEDEVPLVQRACDTLAEVGATATFVSKEDLASLKARKDGALSVIANLGVAKSVRAARIFQQTAYEVLAALFRAGISIVLMA